MCVGPTKPAVSHAGMAFIVDSKGHYPARCLAAASDGCGHGHFLFLRMNTPPPPPPPSPSQMYLPPGYGDCI